ALAEVHRQRAGEGHDGALGCGIIDQLWIALVGSERGGIDDGATLEDMRQSRFGQQEHAAVIAPEGPLPLLLGTALKPVLRVLLSGIVDQHIDAPPLVDDRTDHLLTELRLTQVAGQHQHLASGSPDFVLRLPRILPFLRLAEVEQGDPCSFSGKMYRHRSAYAAVGAGDHRHPALQLARTAVLLGDEYRLRVHALLGSRTL